MRWTNGIPTAAAQRLVEILSLLEKVQDLPGDERATNFTYLYAGYILNYCEELFRNKGFWERMPDGFEHPWTRAWVDTNNLRITMGGIFHDNMKM